MPNVMTAQPNIGGALCSRPQFGWRPLLECRAVTLPRGETRWNYLGCPKLTKRSQTLVGRSSPFCEDMWGRYCCLTSFFFRLRRYSLTKLCDGAQMAIFCIIFASCISSDPRRAVARIFTARRNARIASAVLAIAIPSVCLAFRLSVRPSVTRR